MWLTLALLSLILSLVPCVLFVRNLREFHPLPAAGPHHAAISVLIPARNEQAHIAAALDSVLRSEAIDLEVLILDDLSTDCTAALVREFAGREARVRLLSGQCPPPGWCGKNYACEQLAAVARHPLLLFMDADVRVSTPDALRRLAAFVDQSGAQLVSGVPRQQTQTWLETMIIPLIHFVLLGFLPLGRMRSSTDPRCAAACGQIVAVQRHAYRSSGGHRAIASCLHDAVALARNFRRHGLPTDLFDATDTFHCRLYRNAAQVWTGFAKNAHEGLGSSALLLPASLLLLGGQVLPLVLLAAAPSFPAKVVAIAALACSLLPRWLGARRFEQPWRGALWHPLAVALLVTIQWQAALSRACGRQIVWKGRTTRAVQ